MRRLKLARLLAGFSRGQAAGRARLGHRTLASWEDGEARPPFAGVLNLAQLYGVPAESLAGDYELRDLVEATRNHA